MVVVIGVGGVLVALLLFSEYRYNEARRPRGFTTDVPVHAEYNDFDNATDVSTGVPLRCVRKNDRAEKSAFLMIRATLNGDVNRGPAKRVMVSVEADGEGITKTSPLIWEEFAATWAPPCSFDSGLFLDVPSSAEGVRYRAEWQAMRRKRYPNYEMSDADLGLCQISYLVPVEAFREQAYNQPRQFRIGDTRFYLTAEAARAIAAFADRVYPPR